MKAVTIKKKIVKNQCCSRPVAQCCSKSSKVVAGCHD